MRSSAQRMRSSYFELLPVWLLAAIACLSLSGCAGAMRKPINQGETPAVLENYFAALNRRDLLVLTAYVTPDVEWYSVVRGERVLEVSGREGLTLALKAHFAQNDRTRWSIEKIVSANESVAVRERSQWHDARGNGERITLCVYEFRAGRIARITHYLPD